MFNTGQMLLVLGALLLFSLLLPSLNGTILYNDRTMVETQAELIAMSLAQKFLAEAGTRAFDEVCLTTSPWLASQLTPSGSLGRESGENYPNYDDLDDYKSLSLLDSLSLPSVNFTVSGQVTYMNPTNPTVISSSQTFVKRLRVTVTSPLLVNPASDTPVTVYVEQLFSYY